MTEKLIIDGLTKQRKGGPGWKKWDGGKGNDSILACYWSMLLIVRVKQNHNKVTVNHLK